MNIFEQQRHKILNDYLRSPRCIKAKPSKPNNQFHSWKNYLNTDINTLCNKIRNSKPSASKSQYQYTNQNQIKDASSQEYKDRQVEMVENYQICNFNDEAEQQQENRNCYSKVEVLANNVHKHRHSNSSFAGQKKDEKYVAKSTTPTSEMEGFSSRSQGLESINYSPFSESVKTKFMSTSESQNRQNVNWGKKSNRNTFYSTVSSVQKTVKRRDMDEDTYHQQLKQAERLYLLQKFVEHYESIHNFKM